MVQSIICVMVQGLHIHTCEVAACAKYWCKCRNLHIAEVAGHTTGQTSLRRTAHMIYKQHVVCCYVVVVFTVSETVRTC